MLTIKIPIYSFALVSVILLFHLALENKSSTISTKEAVILTDFSPKTVPSGHKSQYDIKLTMDKEGTFQIESTVHIKNASNDSWNQIVFYFIPNMFTQKIAEELNNPLASPSKVEITNITLNGDAAHYDLHKDTLSIPLKKELKPEKDVQITFSYHLTLPEKGFRFTKNNQNYYLAQFYPMLATYQNHQWNKKDYRLKGETYHTAFSDFQVSYHLPAGFTLASSSDQDMLPSKISDDLQANKVKEMFIAILHHPEIVRKVVNNVEIRVFDVEDNENLAASISTVATDALKYFQKTIGPYPFKQLDIILDQSGMEYPGIVTAKTLAYAGPVDEDRLKSMVVHEIAHQWFYGVISNDPYQNAWLDEGFAEFATSLYFSAKIKEKIPYEIYHQTAKELPLPINLPLDQYKGASSSYTYGKALSMLWKLFENRGGAAEAKRFLKTYYHYYQYKEVDSKEFVRFSQQYFHMKDDAFFQDWLDLQ